MDSDTVSSLLQEYLDIPQSPIPSTPVPSTPKTSSRLIDEVFFITTVNNTVITVGKTAIIEVSTTVGVSIGDMFVFANLLAVWLKVISIEGNTLRVFVRPAYDSITKVEQIEIPAGTRLERILTVPIYQTNTTYVIPPEYVWRPWRPRPRPRPLPPPHPPHPPHPPRPTPPPRPIPRPMPGQNGGGIQRPTGPSRPSRPSGPSRPSRTRLRDVIRSIFNRPA